MRQLLTRDIQAVVGSITMTGVRAAALLLLAITFSSAPSVFAFYSSKGAVENLDSATFTSKVRGDTAGIWLIEFYAPWYVHANNSCT